MLAFYNTSGLTAEPGTLADDVIRAAGFENLAGEETVAARRARIAAIPSPERLTLKQQGLVREFRFDLSLRLRDHLLDCHLFAQRLL